MDKEATIIDMGNNTFFVSIIYAIGVIQFVDENSGKTIVIPNVTRREIELYENGASIDEAFPAMTSLNRKALEYRMNGIDNIKLN